MRFFLEHPRNSISLEIPHAGNSKNTPAWKFNVTAHSIVVYICIQAVARVRVPATIILKFAVAVIFKIQNSKVYR